MCEMTPREELAHRVAKGHADDGERAEHLSVRLSSDEQRDADEADADADEAEARHPHLTEEAECDDGIEDRDGGLKDRGEAGIDAGLAPGEEPERQRDVDERHDEQPTGVVPDLGDSSAAADRHRDDRGERQRSEPEPAHDQRRRVELPHGHLDEEEAGAPEERDGREHHGVAAAAHALL